MKDIDDSIQDDLEETKDDRDSIHEENPLGEIHSFPV